MSFTLPLCPPWAAWDLSSKQAPKISNSEYEQALADNKHYDVGYRRVDYTLQFQLAEQLHKLMADIDRYWSSVITLQHMELYGSFCALVENHHAVIRLLRHGSGER